MTLVREYVMIIPRMFLLFERLCIMREGFEFNISDTDRETLRYRDKCDKYDYIIAAACGTLSGLIDIFFVGSALDVTGMSSTDKQVDSVVKAVAKKCGWTPQEKNAGNPISAVDFMEKKYSLYTSYF